MGGINSIRNREAGRTNCCVIKGREKEKNKKKNSRTCNCLLPLVESGNRFLIMDNNVIKYAL